MDLPEAVYILDSSKIQDYMRCPRAYFFRHVLGWSRSEPSIDLVFGTCWHSAMQVLIEDHYTAGAVEAAINAFTTSYREIYGPEWEEANAPKNVGNAVRGIIQYASKYQYEDRGLELLFSEVAGCVAFGDDLLHFKMDSVVRDPKKGIIAFERKTTGRFSSQWAEQWRLSFQVSLYSYALRCLYKKEEIYGLLIDGFQPHNPPRLKKDGTPYAGDLDNDFMRIPIRRTDKALDAWAVQCAYWISLIKEDLAAAEAVEPDDETFIYNFPQNTTSCGNFRGCPFRDFCATGNPPLYWKGPPEGMTIEYWDPRDLSEGGEPIVLEERKDT